ncbi:MAG TPA: PaaI family thioesterase [Beijerinckiaceae bacterium]|jgi:acyl-coenzyme A thioesterase PaaI-like protein
MSTSDGAPEASAPSELAAQGWKPVKDDGFIGLVGPIYRQERGERWAFAFRAAGKHANLRGVVQGGMLMTFADRALGRNAWKAAGDRPVATIQFDMQFVTAGELGELIEIEPEVVRRTASLVFMRGTLTAGARVVATCTGIWKILG